MYKRVCLNAVNPIVACIKERFDQPEFKAPQSLEMLLVDATHDREYQNSLSDVLNIYDQDIITIELDVQLDFWKTIFDEKEDIISNIRKLHKSREVYFSEVITLLEILLVLSATNAVSEQSSSSLRRIKYWLRTSMTQ